MDSLLSLIACLSGVGLSAEVWVNGSFMTFKIEPKDVDVLVVVDIAAYSGTPQQTAVLTRIEDQDFNVPLRCDSYILTTYPKGHNNRGIGESMFGYWIKQFCFDRKEEFKGVAVIRTPTP